MAALFYSLIETARPRGAHPGCDLLRAALAAIETPGAVAGVGAPSMRLAGLVPLDTRWRAPRMFAGGLISLSEFAML